MRGHRLLVARLQREIQMLQSQLWQPQLPVQVRTCYGGSISVELPATERFLSAGLPHMPPLVGRRGTAQHAQDAGSHGLLQARLAVRVLGSPAWSSFQELPWSCSS